MTSLSLNALIDQLAVSVYDNGPDSEEVNALCNYVRTDANISSEEYEALQSGQKDLLNSACQYTGP